MPKDRKKPMSDGELSEMFLNIGRAKEAVAEGIIAEQKKEDEERRRQLRGKLKIFGGAGEEMEENLDYDKEFQALEQEIEWVRRGKIHKYDSGVVLTQEDSERPDALEDAMVQPGKSESPEQAETLANRDTEDFEILDIPGKKTDDIEENAHKQDEPEIKLEEFILEEPVLEGTSLKPPAQEEPEFELDGVATEPDFLRAYFATAYDRQTGIGCFAYNIFKGDVLLESKTESVVDGKAEVVIFVGASKMLQYIQSTKCNSALLVMSESEGELLRKNAIYGLTGDFGSAAVEYIRKVKELSAECYLRVLSDTHTEEMSAVIRRIQTNQ